MGRLPPLGPRASLRLDPAGLRPRLPRSVGGRRSGLQDVRILGAGARARDHLERPGSRHSLAVSRKPGALEARSPPPPPRPPRRLSFTFLLTPPNPHPP